VNTYATSFDLHGQRHTRHWKKLEVNPQPCNIATVAWNYAVFVSSMQNKNQEYIESSSTIIFNTSFKPWMFITMINYGLKMTVIDVTPPILQAVQSRTISSKIVGPRGRLP